ncbi:MAG: putative type II DNA methylase protein [Mycoplasmataceae bacterium CE_OT135]|nr:MAG: putative type II DNA methylase protein [Mycoplasmataceae bacterium CE_OT135]
MSKKLSYQKIIFVEPSAGTGNFCQAIREINKNNQLISKKILAFDIEPKSEQENIIIANFLKVPLTKYLEKGRKKDYVVIGNPPFGKKGKLALNFINKTTKYIDTIGFILPLTFRRWSIQSKINKDLQLIYDINLEPNSLLVDNKVYELNTCFQIWTKRKSEQKDLRIKEKPITKHSDFEMYLHNNTQLTLKYFQKDKYHWDFAVVRQGFYDYCQKIEKAEDLFKNRQYIFFKSKNELAKQRLLQLDFAKLAQKNMVIPGFGKHDVVVAYNDIC